MFYNITIPGQGSSKIAMINNKVGSSIRTTTRTYGDLFPPEVISDMKVDANDPVTVTLHKSKLHLRWIYVGWPTIIEVASLRSDGTIGWRVAYVGMLPYQTIQTCYDGNLVGTIPSTIGMEVSNLDGITDAQVASNIFRFRNYDRVPPLNTDRTRGDLNLGDVALYLNNLPIFRTWHPTHEDKGAKYSTDKKAFLELHLNDPSRTVPTYELQMNDATSYGSSDYDDAAFVFYTLD